MTNEDYLVWLRGMVEHNRKMSANTDGRESTEYWASAMAYEKAYDVFRSDVMGGEGGKEGEERKNE